MLKVVSGTDAGPLPVYTITAMCSVKVYKSIVLHMLYKHESFIGFLYLSLNNPYPTEWGRVKREREWGETVLALFEAENLSESYRCTCSATLVPSFEKWELEVNMYIFMIVCVCVRMRTDKCRTTEPVYSV